MNNRIRSRKWESIDKKYKHMLQIRPVSDLKNKFPDIEKTVNVGEPVYLTKNGYGSEKVIVIHDLLITGYHTEILESSGKRSCKGRFV